ncbi:p-aminobenzoyl-glutamate transporter AbgT [Clostridium tetanomorphum]|uniref:AbgT family transporter n=2 Tax=Clostridium TaxID=1485 RepID=A0A923J244_CLOTT|nr:AbgT family transporter [Clostridium tetanomorphum]KAJ52893.1 Aminobenzoyl-glutamate transport protein [Clostridium tetanomorphum DSM 665]MBC2399896.1 AbgT family transporter [Clostridium tetanomorphum]MBP1865969.1 p-aminobenzoyl-glutamate transporter AbgT [Clostridium tetanomorphum]NRS85977.1 p-aminobenzoyl-glutamate transporter AbgT [Clostridium tetanomorphum]NRZ96013.1 p-aminobenzoyl-glutamate transporter AbgT [Clostridium tetanomorphum]
MNTEKRVIQNKKVGGFLGWVERIGNKIPHPFILFLWLIVIVWIASLVCSFIGVSVKNPVDEKIIVVKNLLSASGIRYMLESMIKNFTGFAPLGLVLTMTLGIGLAEHVGFISAFMRDTILGASPKVVTFTVMLIGICGNIASDAAIVVVPAIAAVIFASMGRHPKTYSLVPSPFLNSIIPLLLILFIIVSYIYGKEVGKITSMIDLPKYMTIAMKDMSSYIVLVFVIGQFIAYFNWSNLGYIIAVNGANALKAANFKGIPLFVMFILLTAFINLFIGSGSAKWALLAPIFVPMFYMLDYSPAITQMLYRIGDSTTNIISPLFPYFPIIIGLANEYEEEAGVGTILSLMIPYSLIMLAVWIVLGMTWFAVGLPLGPA